MAIGTIDSLKEIFKIRREAGLVPVNDLDAFFNVLAECGWHRGELNAIVRLGHVHWCCETGAWFMP